MVFEVSQWSRCQYSISPQLWQKIRVPHAIFLINRIKGSCAFTSIELWQWTTLQCFGLGSLTLIHSLFSDFFHPD